MLKQIFASALLLVFAVARPVPLHGACEYCDFSGDPAGVCTPVGPFSPQGNTICQAGFGKDCRYLGFTCEDNPTFMGPDGTLRVLAVDGQAAKGLEWDASERGWRTCQGILVVLTVDGAAEAEVSYRFALRL